MGFLGTAGVLIVMAMRVSIAHLELELNARPTVCMTIHALALSQVVRGNNAFTTLMNMRQRQAGQHLLLSLIMQVGIQISHNGPQPNAGSGHSHRMWWCDNQIAWFQWLCDWIGIGFPCWSKCCSKVSQFGVAAS